MAEWTSVGGPPGHRSRPCHRSRGGRACFRRIGGNRRCSPVVGGCTQTGTGWVHWRWARYAHRLLERSYSCTVAGIATWTGGGYGDPPITYILLAAVRRRAVPRLLLVNLRPEARGRGPRINCTMCGSTGAVPEHGDSLKTDQIWPTDRSGLVVGLYRECDSPRPGSNVNRSWRRMTTCWHSTIARRLVRSGLRTDLTLSLV